MAFAEQALQDSRAEDIHVFQLACALIIIWVLDREFGEGATLERLTYYEVFAAHPYLLFAADEPEWLELISCGCELRTVGYASSGHKYVTQRQRAKTLASALVARGLVRVVQEEGRFVVRITDLGRRVASDIQSLYAWAFARSAALVLKRLHKLSDKRLGHQARVCLGHGLLLMELGE